MTRLTGCLSLPCVSFLHQPGSACQRPGGLFLCGLLKCILHSGHFRLTIYLCTVSFSPPLCHMRLAVCLCVFSLLTHSGHFRLTIYLCTVSFSPPLCHMRLAVCLCVL